MTAAAPTSVVGSPPPLFTTSIELGSGLFLTDRGWQVLPAWLFSLGGIHDPAKVLAVAPSDMYMAPVTHAGTSPAQLSVTVGVGGRRIIANFAGASSGTGPCTASYTLSVKESKQAVAVAVIPHPHGENGGTVVACTAEAHLRHATAELRAPLGARVVVDASTEGAVSATPA